MTLLVIPRQKEIDNKALAGPQVKFLIPFEFQVEKSERRTKAG